MHAPQPPRKTFVDYAAVAVCPGLIMLLVGSLIFFLLAVGYAGSHVGELRWTFFWFVLAMVLVSRIAIERGSEYAGIYGLALALATAFMLSRYVELQLWLLALLALIWWATHKLTWDCTVIEDDQDASGEGLLQAARLAPAGRHTETTKPEALPLSPKLDGGRPAKKAAKVPWWERPPTKRAKHPHAPGIWVIYFSLGALPTFGLGQGFIAREDAATRQQAFYLLGLYLAAALGLLLVSSFLGLRRYLRQRFLQMPSAMAATWLSTGTFLASTILLACLLLPRPSAYWSLTAMIERLGDPPKLSQNQGRPGNQAQAKTDPDANSHGQASGAASADRTPDTSTADAPSASQGKAAGREAGQSDSKSASSPGGQTAGDSSRDASRGTASEPARNGETSANAPAPSAVQPAPASSLQTPLKLLRVVLHIGLAALVLVLLVKHYRRVWWLLQELWRALLELWAGLFSRKAKPAAAAVAAPPPTPRRPFAALPNPFASGTASQMSPEELVVLSFQGLEAWAEEHNLARAVDQTPFEFADRVAGNVPELAYEVQEVSRLYAQVAYAPTAPLPPCRTVLEILWSKLTMA